VQGQAHLVAQIAMGRSSTSEWRRLVVIAPMKANYPLQV